MDKNVKLVVIESYGTLTELGGISGPVLNPAYIDIDLIIRMVNKNKRVYEVNPKNHSERVRLTLKNVRAVNFDTTKPQVAPAPAKTSAPATAKKTTVPEVKKDEKKSDLVDSDFTKK